MYTENELNILEVKELIHKQQFIKQLNAVIIANIPNIKNITYDIFRINQEFIYEYLVVTYSNDSIDVRNCSMDSLSAILKELSKLLDGGYYDEVEWYKQLKQDLSCADF